MHVAANPMTLEPAPADMATRLKPAFDLLDRAVTDGAFPGGVLAVGLNDQLIVHPFGKLTRDAKAPAVTANTIYDVASLTKPIVTTTSVMMLVQQKRLDLDAPVARYLPELAAAAKSDPDPSLARARDDSHATSARFRLAGASRFLQASQRPRRDSRARARRAARARAGNEGGIFRPRFHSCSAKSSSGSPAIRSTNSRSSKFLLRSEWMHSHFNPPRKLRPANRAHGK